MNNATSTASMKRIVILGAGFGGTYTLRQLHRLIHGRDDIMVTLVNDTNYFLFTPLLHEVATGGVAPSLVVEPLRGILRCCLKNLHIATVDSVDTERRLVKTNRGNISYDFLVVALGSTTNFVGVPGAEEHVFVLKTLGDAQRLKNHVIDQFELAATESDDAMRRQRLRFVIVGGGPTAVEVAAELADLCFRTTPELYAHADLQDLAEVVLVQSQTKLLPRFPERMGSMSLAALKKQGVVVHLNRRVTRVKANDILFDDGSSITASTVVWAAGVAPQPLSFLGDVPRDASGRILVKPTLQVEGHPSVFALGDIAKFIDPTTRQPARFLAQVATKQAPVVAHNLMALVDGASLRSFRYRHSGDLLSLGHWLGVANIGSLFFSGRFAWWLWRTVYLTKMLSWRKKVKVVVDWTWDLFVPRDISQLP